MRELGFYQQRADIQATWIGLSLGEKPQQRGKQTVRLWGDRVQGPPVTASADVTVPPSELSAHPGRL